MGILDMGIKILQDIKYEISDDPFMVGLRFEDYVQSLFSKKYFSIAEKTHSTETNQKQYVESSMNPDFVFRYMPTGKQFAVECKYRSGLKEGRLNWSYPKQMKRYQEFSHKRKIPVFIVIGLGGEDDEPEEMFNIPLGKQNIQTYTQAYLIDSADRLTSHFSGKMGSCIRFYFCSPLRWIIAHRSLISESYRS